MSSSSFTIDLDKIANVLKEDIRKDFISQAKRVALRSVERHFEDTRTHIGGGKFQHIRGAGTIEIDDFITMKFVDDAGMKAYMQKFFDENYQRIMDECLTKAMTHHCNRLAFKHVEENAPKVLSTTSFNPAEGSPQTAMQMALVMSLRDAQKPKED